MRNPFALVNALSAYILSSHVPYKNRQWASQQLLKCISSKIQISIPPNVEQINYADLSNSLPSCDSFTLEGHDNRVAVLAWHEASATLASAGYDGTVRIWVFNGVQELLLERTLIFHKSYEMFGCELHGKLIGHLKWSPGRDYIAAAMENVINVWCAKETCEESVDTYGFWFIEDQHEFVTAMTWPKYKSGEEDCRDYLLVGKIDGSVSLMTVVKHSKELQHLVNCSLTFGK